MEKLKRSFYERDALTVAKDILGKYLVTYTPAGTTVGKIIEVEAYMGFVDAGSHTYQGKRTARTEVIFGPGGHAYVYLIYGMYYCLNIIVNRIDVPEVVLIRALEPVDGIELMKQRRGTDRILNLCSGPGKLSTAMGISLKENGIDLCGETMYLLSGDTVDSRKITRTPRINIDYAGEARDYPWRFLVQDNPFVSKKLRNK
ncbi:MAG TPA: DNA-3-methyladenine glycosylase [Bacillota bacterium]|nr:DNA-3-methyladenine glycosylase [Bacillota bacterium]